MDTPANPTIKIPDVTPPERSYTVHARADGKSVRFDLYASTRLIAWHTAIHRLMYLFPIESDTGTDVTHIVLRRNSQ